MVIPGLSIPRFAHGGFAAVADDGRLEKLLVLEELILLLPVHEGVQQGEGLLVLGRRVHQLLPAAQRAGDVLELAAAHLLFLQVDHLEPDAPLLEVALGLFGIEALARAEDLDVHAFVLPKVSFHCIILRPGCIGIFHGPAGQTSGRLKFGGMFYESIR